MKLSAEQKKAHLAAGLNEDGSIKENKDVKPTMLELNSSENYERSEMVINEIMIQKGCSRSEAAIILTNPTK